MKTKNEEESKKQKLCEKCIFKKICESAIRRRERDYGRIGYIDEIMKNYCPVADLIRKNIQEHIGEVMTLKESWEWWNKQIERGNVNEKTI